SQRDEKDDGQPQVRAEHGRDLTEGLRARNRDVVDGGAAADTGVDPGVASLDLASCGRGRVNRVDRKPHEDKGGRGWGLSIPDRGSPTISAARPTFAPARANRRRG